MVAIVLGPNLPFLRKGGDLSEFNVDEWPSVSTDLGPVRPGTSEPYSFVMNTSITPTTIAAPAANYSLAVHSSAGSQWLHTAGIVGTRADGSIASTIGEQAEEIWRSIAAIFNEAHFAITDLVSYTTYAVLGHDLSAVMTARDHALNGHRAASTLIVVPTLARPEWLVEIVAIAAN